MSVIIKRKRRGFTLVELVIVVAIVAIIASIAVVKYADVTGSSKMAAFQSNHKSLTAAYNMHIMQNNSRPTSINDLYVYIVNSGTPINIDGNPEGAVYVLLADGTLQSTYNGEILTYLP